MKKTFATLTLLLILLTATFTLAQQQTIAGTWQFRVDVISLRLVLEQKGKKITGTLQNPHGPDPIHIDGEFSDGKWTFTGWSKGGEWDYKLSGTGTLQADGSMAGSLTSNANTGDLTWTAIKTEGK